MCYDKIFSFEHFSIKKKITVEEMKQFIDFYRNKKFKKDNSSTKIRFDPEEESSLNHFESTLCTVHFFEQFEYKTFFIQVMDENGSMYEHSFTILCSDKMYYLVDLFLFDTIYKNFDIEALKRFVLKQIVIKRGFVGKITKYIGEYTPINNITVNEQIGLCYKTDDPLCY